MPRLHELQRRFAEALFDGATAHIAPSIVGEGIAPAQRLAIYRNNLHEGFRKALALEFPVIERLVGPEYFAQLALEFQRAHPSRSGDLARIGAPFAAFLRERFAATDYAYLPDVAALEWACEEVSIAGEPDDFDPAVLRNVRPERYGELRFALAPGVRLVASPFPIERIWSANQPSSDAEESIDLGAGADRLLVRRGRSGLELRRMPPAEYTLLASLAAGMTLAESFEAALASSEAGEPIDLGGALRRFVALGLFGRALLPN